MKILSIKVNNILSIGDMAIDFENSGLVLVEGWNYDDNRANGAGKTAIFNALAFGLYDDLPRKITATEILKKGAKNGFVEVTLSVGNDIYIIKRERPIKVTFHKNGVLIDMSQKEFESIVKLTYDQFLISMYTAQSASSKFINLNDSMKKDFLLQLMNLTDFATCKDIVDDEITRFTIEISKLKGEIDIAKSKIEVYNESLSGVVAISLVSEIETYRKMINKNQEVTKPDTSKYSDAEGKLREKLDTISKAKSKRSDLMTQYRRLSAEASSIECPHCDGKVKITDNHIVKADDTEGITTQLSSLKDKMDKLDILIAMDNDIRTKLTKLRSDKEVHTSDYQKAVERIANFQALIKTKEGQVVAFQKIRDLEAKMSNTNTIMLNYMKEVEVCRTISQMFAPTGAPAYILDSIIDGFNESINTHLSLIWPSASYQLKTYKQNVRGDISAKFSEELIVGGKERSIGSLSGGEKRSLSLAIDFAVIDILHKQFGIELNPIIMDEPFNDLDVNGREVVIDVLEKLSVDKQIWVIDHATEAKALFNKVYKVDKRNGTSSGSWA